MTYTPFALVSDPHGGGQFEGFWRDPRDGSDYHDTTDLFFLDSDAAVKRVVELAKDRGEIAIVVIDGQRAAHFVYTQAVLRSSPFNGTLELGDVIAAGQCLGRFQRTDETRAELDQRGEGYTYDPAAGSVWVVRPF